MTEQTNAPKTVTEKLTAKRTSLAERATKLAAQYNDVAAEIDKIDAELAALSAVANVAAGDRVDAVIGRGEKAVNVINAEVIGVQEDETGKRVKVTSGYGFDTQVYVLTPAQITKVITAEELAQANAPVAEEEQPAE